MSYKIKDDIIFTRWYKDREKEGYKGLSLDSLQDIIDKFVNYYSTLDESNNKGIKGLSVNEYRFMSCYYRKNEDYDIKNNPNKKELYPRQDSIEIFSKKGKNSIIVFYDESGKLYNVFDNKKNKFLFDGNEELNLQDLYVFLSNNQRVFDLREYKQIMFTQAVDYFIRDFVVGKIEKSLDIEHAKLFKDDVTEFFGYEESVEYDDVYDYDIKRPNNNKEKILVKGFKTYVK